MSTSKIIYQETKNIDGTNLKIANRINDFLKNLPTLMKSDNMELLNQNMYLFKDSVEPLNEFEQAHFKSLVTDELSTFVTDGELSRIELIEFLYLTYATYRSFFIIESLTQPKVDAPEDMESEDKRHQPSREMSITFYTILNTFNALGCSIEKETGKKINGGALCKILLLALHAMLILKESENKETYIMGDSDEDKPSLSFLNQVEVLRFIMQEKCPDFSFGYNDFSNSIFLHGDIFRQNFENVYLSEKDKIDLYTDRLLILDGDDYKKSQKSVIDFLHDNKEDLKELLRR